MSIKHCLIAEGAHNLNRRNKNGDQKDGVSTRLDSLSGTGKTGGGAAKTLGPRGERSIGEERQTNLDNEEGGGRRDAGMHASGE